MKILVVVDMQKDFIDGSLGSKEAQALSEECQQPFPQASAHTSED